MHSLVHCCLQKVVDMAVALKEAANELFNKQQYLPASEKYKAAWFWIATIVKSKLLKVKEAVLEQAKKEAVLILGNLSNALLKLNQPHLAMAAATECITMNTDGSYFKVRCNYLVVFQLQHKCNFPITLDCHFKMQAISFHCQLHY